MTPQELKSSILQLAVQGRLVEQRPEEGTAEVLYRQIQEEKQRLIKEGKIKKEKPLPEIAEDEVPFDIPESWKWIRIIDLYQLLNGDRGKNYPSKSTLSKSGIPFISALNLNGKTVINDENLLCMSQEQYDRLGNGKLQFDDIVVCIRGSLGKHGRYPFKLGAIASSLVILRPIICKREIADYFMYYIDSFLFSSEIRKYDNGTAQPNLSAQNLKHFLVPLPPLAEQKRIVAKIEELLPYIDRYEKAWSKLEDFNKRFPGDMQKSVLQMAIQGKLVEQRPEEGTGEELYRQIQAEKQSLIKSGKIKKEKPLPEISEDEIPFDIPESWRWVRMAEVIDVRDGTHDTPKYVTNGVPLVTSKNLVYGRIDFESTKLISHQDAEMINMRSAVNDNDILFAMIGTIGNPVLVKKDREFAIKNMALFKAINKQLFNMNYLLLFLSKEQHEMKKKASGGVQSFVSLKFLRNYLIPLPPLAEQKRIVQKLEEILPLCEKLK